MPEFTLREALPGDLENLIALLERLGLVTEGVLVPGTAYWLAETPMGRLLGLVGVEFGTTNAALLRSAAVLPELQRRGIGRALVNRAFEACRACGIATIYCFSTDAGDYWQHLGFREAPVTELVEALPAAPQVLHFGRIGWLPTEVAWRLDL